MAGDAMEQTKRREEAILGKPGRMMPPVDPSEEMLALCRLPPPAGVKGELPEHHLVMLHNPELLRLQRDVGAYFLLHAKMAPRDRELAILRTAWLCQAPYVWGEHVAAGKQIGLTTGEIERVTTGSSATGWDMSDRAVIRAVEELIGDAMISDETWAILAETMTEDQLVELPVLVAQYQCVTYFQNSLRIRIRPSNPGLSAR
jgi:alkylhydroperoxidase family enzyme